MALAQLETALRLYFEQHDYYSVITLAGAADEIFGKLLIAKELDSSIESLKRSVATIHKVLTGQELAPSAVVERANRARNALKHWSPAQPPIVLFDSLEESKDMLNRAIDNYWALEARLSPAMEQFQRECFAAPQLP
ncbi:MAG: hypothetical protein Q7S20_04590 [Gemmatimonadaceae bacterium]|nr:hypothetical protein [Gemmatimonadaceae bacterium]